MAQFEDIVKSGFLVESAELIERAEKRFLDLESDPGDREIVDDLFRVIHTVKSSAYAAGFEKLAAFLHTVETLLYVLREGKLEPNAHILDLLIRSNDQVLRNIRELSADYKASIDASELTDSINAAMSGVDVSALEQASPSIFQSLRSAISRFRSGNDSSEVPSVSPRSIPGNRATFDLPKPPPGIQLRSASTPTILICDDEPEIVLLASEVLKYRYPTLTVMSAFDGADALLKSKEHRPHVIITDLRMPNLNGIDFVRELRKFDANVPVIFFSAYADRENMIEFIKLGVMDFQEKPIDPDRLSLTVATGLKLAQHREGTTRLSTLNFRAYMLTLSMSQLGPDRETEASEISSKVKVILDEVAVLSNFMLGL